jgi:type I restriction enzyme S subunit
LFYVLLFNTYDLSKVGGYSRHYKFLKNKPIPLPPLAEQKRIVAKIEELMPLVDRYEKALDEVDSKRR